VLVDKRLCDWCLEQLGATAALNARFCGKKCRQAAWRLKVQVREDRAARRPRRFAYADPPYPGLAKKYYGREPTFAGEVDFAALVSRLETYDGWALSTSSRSLRDILPLCPSHARVCAWVHPRIKNYSARGLCSSWEPVIVVPGRRRRRAIQDWVCAGHSSRPKTLIGRKPIAFCAQLFDWMGMMPGDSLDDLFPGTGIVTRCWREAGRRARARETAHTTKTVPLPEFSAVRGCVCRLVLGSPLLCRARRSACGRQNSSQSQKCLCLHASSAA